MPRHMQYRPMAKNKNKHLIQLPVSVNLEKVRKPVESCPTILLKVDTGADVNLLNSTTFDQVIGNRSILQPSTLKMENYGSSRIEVLGKFYAFLRWKGKIYRQPFYVTTANTSPNLLSRDACYTLGVVKPCYTVEAEWSNLHVDLQANLQGLHVADLQTNLHGHNAWQIYKVIYRATNHRSTALKLQIHKLSDEKLKQIIQVFWSKVQITNTVVKCGSQTEITIQAFYTKYSTEYWDSEQQKGFNWSQYWIWIQIYTWMHRTFQIYNWIYKISRIYNMICNQIYTDSDSQSEETASSSG